MNPALVDHLVCPRCGPPHALVLLTKAMQGGKVEAGELGCPNCRDRFEIEAGVADLRPPVRVVGGGDQEVGEPQSATPDALDPSQLALRFAAALGVTSGPGLILLSQVHAEVAVPLVQVVPAVEVVVVGAAGWGDRALRAEGVSAIVAAGLPFRDGNVRGVVVEGGESDWFLPEAVRVVSPGARIVCTGKAGQTRKQLRATGLKVVLDSPEAFVVEQSPASALAAGATPRLASWGGKRL